MSTTTAEPGLEPDATTAAGAAAAPRPPAALVARRFLWAFALVALDLWSKAAVFAWMEPLRRADALTYDLHGHPRWPIAGDWLTVMLSLNPGAAFGQLDAFPYLLVGGRIAAVAFLAWLIVRTPRGRPGFSLALVLVLGGALGNLYDNLLRARDLDLDRWYAELPFGPVRDFIDVYFAVWDWHFPTFNVADSCITVGAALLLFSGFGPSGRARRRDAGASPGDSPAA